MKRSNHLSDGYTCPGFIKGIPNLYEDMRFTFRPALVEERSQILDTYKTLKPDAFDRKVANFMQPRLKTWDVVDEKGTAVPVTAKNILCLPPELFGRLWQIVSGFEACDTDPNWPDDVTARADADNLESALSGATVGEVREATDAKN